MQKLEGNMRCRCRNTHISDGGILKDGVVSCCGLDNWRYTCYRIEEKREIIALKLVYLEEDDLLQGFG